jgi:hypothetical protein
VLDIAIAFAVVVVSSFPSNAPLDRASPCISAYAPFDEFLEPTHVLVGSRLPTSSPHR